MDNTSRPKPGDRSEGCFNCGGGKNEVLASKLNKGASVALCSKCFDQPVLHTQPYSVRAS